MKRLTILPAALTVTILTSILMMAQFLGNLRYFWRSNSVLGEVLPFLTLVAYALLLLGLRKRGPLLVSLIILLWVGWLRDPWLFKLLPGSMIEDLYRSWAFSLDSDLRVFTVMLIPVLAFQSLRRESPAGLSSKYFSRAQVVHASSVLAFVASDILRREPIGFCLEILALSFTICMLLYLFVGSSLLLRSLCRPAQVQEGRPASNLSVAKHS